MNIFESFSHIHPAFVHFPIGLLSVYAVMELLRFSYFTRRPWWETVKKRLLYIGVPLAYVTIVTGVMIKGAVGFTGTTAHVVSTHQAFAWVMTLTFTILFAAYFFAGRGNVLAQKFVASLFVPIIALLGLVGLFIVGSLGASIVYGPGVDPIVSFIYSTLFPGQ